MVSPSPTAPFSSPRATVPNPGGEGWHGLPFRRVGGGWIGGVPPHSGCKYASAHSHQSSHTGCVRSPRGTPSSSTQKKQNAPKFPQPLDVTLILCVAPCGVVFCQDPCCETVCNKLLCFQLMVTRLQVDLPHATMVMTVCSCVFSWNTAATGTCVGVVPVPPPHQAGITECMRGDAIGKHCIDSTPSSGLFGSRFRNHRCAVCPSTHINGRSYSQRKLESDIGISQHHDGDSTWRSLSTAVHFVAFSRHCLQRQKTIQ